MLLSKSDSYDLGLTDFNSHVAIGSHVAPSYHLPFSGFQIKKDLYLRKDPYFGHCVLGKTEYIYIFPLYPI